MGVASESVVGFYQPLPPAVLLVALAMRVSGRDCDLPSHPINCCRACAAIGCALPLGTSAYLSLVDPEPWRYPAMLVVGGDLCLLAVARLGNRSLAVSGALWLALGLCRAFALFAQVGPGPVVLVLLAVLALAAGAAATALHDRLAHAWHQWI